MLDLIKAEEIELLVDAKGHVWINVDGRCQIRVQNCKTVFVERNNMGSEVIYNPVDGLIPAKV